MDFLPAYEFQKCVSRYRGDHKVQNFSCRDQFLSMAFAQLTYRESLRDIETCLLSIGSKLYHMGFRSKVARSTLADANESRDWRIYAQLCASLDCYRAPAVCERSDHTVILTAFDSAKVYPDSLRRVSYLDIENEEATQVPDQQLCASSIYDCPDL